MGRLAVAVLVAWIVVAASAGNGAGAETNCEWYAKLALRQQQINDEKKCGFNGDAWHKDLGAHLKWCQGVAPDLWKAQAQARNAQLDECEKK